MKMNKPDPVRKKWKDPNYFAARTKSLDILEDNFHLFLRENEITEEDFRRSGPASDVIKEIRKKFVTWSYELGFMGWEIALVTGMSKNSVSRYKNA